MRGHVGGKIHLVMKEVCYVTNNKHKLFVYRKTHYQDYRGNLYQRRFYQCEYCGRKSKDPTPKIGKIGPW